MVGVGQSLASLMDRAVHTNEKAKQPVFWHLFGSKSESRLISAHDGV